MGRKRKHLPISVHPTLDAQLKVNWQQEYNNEFKCPYCKTGEFKKFYRVETSVCRLGLVCDDCERTTYLTQKVGGSPKKHLPISYHRTLDKVLKIDWRLEYSQAYNCPRCNKGKLTGYHYHSQSICKLSLSCNNCRKRTGLSCRVPAYIYSYLPKIECPNPLCTNIGHNGQKGWVYQRSSKYNSCKCRFCQIVFDSSSTFKSSWIGSQINNVQAFDFKEDIWDLYNFYSKPCVKKIIFEEINPVWYKQIVKQYLYFLLKSFSCSIVKSKVSTLKELGRTIIKLDLCEQCEIDRDTVLYFLNSCKDNTNQTFNRKLAVLRDFFNWLNLETSSLIRSRDFLKVSKNDADWLDEVTRLGIKQHLNKIPAPIARHYKVQTYLAARPGDTCQLAWDCLIEENGKWYVKFFQQKTQRWHKILASRKIRKVIEEQQRWIRKVFGKNYPYLFCQFRTIRQESYPEFSNIKPLPKPPKSNGILNPMVRIIRMLIEEENVLDANGKKPHFTGKIIRHSRLQEVRTKYGMEAAQLYADHKSSRTTFQHYAPPTREQIAEVDLPFQKLLLNPDNKFLPWQSLPESLLRNPTAHELDLEIAPRLVVYGHCALDPKTPCPVNLFPKCYGCSSFRPSTGKLPLYERQYQGEQQRLTEAETVGAELASEEAKATITAMDKWLPELRRLANG